jgi:serine protease Do
VLRLGDRTPLDTRRLQLMVLAATIAQTVPVTVLRDGQERVLQLTIKESLAIAAEIRTASTQAAAPIVTIPTDLGLSLSTITDDVRAKYRLGVARSGVVINGIAAGTDAATRALSSGDVILRMQDEPVQTSQQV